MKSVMTHDFSNNPSIKGPRSSFDRSFGYKTTFDAGYLIPFYVDDVLPGDTFNLSTTGFARLSTPEFPFMDNLYMDTHFFFVPLRLVWDNSKKFFGEQANPGDSIDYSLPTMSSYTPAEADLSDYLGLPPGNAMTPVSIYHRGYNLIWNEWFRDQNLQDSVVVDTDDGPDTDTDYVLLRRGKRHDYFTSALTAPQKGAAVSLPLGVADVKTDAVVGNVPGVYVPSLSNYKQLDADSTQVDVSTNNASSSFKLYTDDTTATINDLRESFQIQKLLERDMRGGTRYSELVANHFGVNFYDVSYRPEFLGGGSTPVMSNPVQVTTRNSFSPFNEVGDVGATTTAAFNNHGFTKSFVEHGFIIGLISVRADLTYQQGIPKHFLKSTRYDIYWPSLAHLGEQVIENQEIYHQNLAADTDAFGYQERYAEYRYKPSQITGAFRSSAATPLDAWHLSQEFSALPILGDTFIQENPPVDRIIITSTEPHFILDTYTKLRCARPMPMYGVPGLIDHF